MFVCKRSAFAKKKEKRKKARKGWQNINMLFKKLKTLLPLFFIYFFLINSVNGQSAAEKIPLGK